MHNLRLRKNIVTLLVASQSKAVNTEKYQLHRLYQTTQSATVIIKYCYCYPSVITTVHWNAPKIRTDNKEKCINWQHVRGRLSLWSASVALELSPAPLLDLSCDARLLIRQPYLVTARIRGTRTTAPMKRRSLHGLHVHLTKLLQSQDTLGWFVTCWARTLARRFCGER